MNRKQPLVQVDAFTAVAFAGNPAAVCVMTESKPDAWMQRVAAEMNLSETAFLVPEQDGFRLRWFTPAVEVDLCGHATLASAHVLWEDGVLQPDQKAIFHTRSGPLGATREDGWIILDFPVKLSTPASPPEGLLAALGVAEGTPVHRNAFDYLIELPDPASVYALEPNFSALRKVETRGVIVTSRSDRPDADFISRFFAPAAGVDEDPVTGSAHCALGPYWNERLGKRDLVGYQASPRGGIVRVGMRGDRVLLGGQAVTVLRGELLA